VNEPAIVGKVRELLKHRAREFESGGPHTATFTIYRSYNGCFLRINDRWALISHRGLMQDDTMMFNDLGVSDDLTHYPSGFVHTNCHSLAEMLAGLGFISQAECVGIQIVVVEGVRARATQGCTAACS
jgi:hypothetical protein